MTHVYNVYVHEYIQHMNVIDEKKKIPILNYWKNWKNSNTYPMPKVLQHSTGIKIQMCYINKMFTFNIHI